MIKPSPHKKPFNLGIVYDEKRCGYFVAGDGFDFFMYFTQNTLSDSQPTFLECDSVERQGYGDGYSARICIPYDQESSDEDGLISKINDSLVQEEFFFIADGEFASDDSCLDWQLNEEIFGKRAGPVVKLILLDENDKEISCATGFLIREKDSVFLYSCWHVVAGFDFLDLKVNATDWPPEKRKIAFMLPNIKAGENAGVWASGQKRITIPLYTEDNGAFVQRWQQGVEDRPHGDLNAVGLKVPLCYDFMKICVTSELTEDEVNYFTFLNKRLLNPKLLVGSALVIVGYPYGFSVFGETSAPHPVHLSRNIAAEMYNVPKTYGFNILLDGAAFPGMSGSPVFVKIDVHFHLIGIYTGSIFPDFKPREDKGNFSNKNNRLAALGMVSLLNYCLESLEESK